MSGPAPVLIALVDLTGSDEWLELVKSALLAALEAVSPYTLFGLITFSTRVSDTHTHTHTHTHTRGTHVDRQRLIFAQVLHTHGELGHIVSLDVYDVF